MKTTTLLITLLMSNVLSSQINLSTNDNIDASTTTCTSATHVSIYYPKAQKHFSDSMSLSNISAQTLYKDAKSKNSIINGYLDVEVAFMESNGYVCQVRRYKVITPDYFELTKKNYCVNEVANFAKNRVRYDGNETIYVLDSSKNYIDTGAVFTPSFPGKYYIEYDNPSVRLNYLDSVTVNPQPSISFTTPIPNTFSSTRPLNKYILSSHISHTGVKLESSSPGVILEGGALTVNVQYMGKFHNLMEYTTVSAKGCRNSLKDTIFIDDTLDQNSPTPLLNDPTYTGFYVTSTNDLASVPMCLTRQECDGGTVNVTNRSPFVYDTNYTFQWFTISENRLKPFNHSASSGILPIPDNGKNDVMHLMCRAIAKHSPDTSLFFNQIIQTHKKASRKFDFCNELGDTNNVRISTVALESDFNNYYWRTGSFDKANYKASTVFHYYKPSGAFVFNADYIINENTSKKTDYRVEYNTTLPAPSNTVSMYRFNGLYISSSPTYNPSVTKGCYVYDTIELILNPAVDVTYQATLNSNTKVALGDNITHSVNNTSAGSSYSWNYFTDTLSGASGNFTTQKPGYVHSGYLIKDSYGCISDSTAYNLFEVDLPVGVKELAQSEVSVFPNPFTDQITIESEGIENANIRLYSLYGALVYQSSANMSTSQKILLPNSLPKGTYILRVVGTDKGFTKKLTKI